MLVPYGAHITISITLLTTEHSQILTMDMLTVNKYLLLSIENVHLIMKLGRHL